MLKERQDAFGQAYWDFYSGRKDASIIIERDDGDREVGMECGVYFSDPAAWPPHQRRALEFARGRVLDVGCGVGRHSLYLQQAGHDVVGIDESPLAIRICRLRGVKDARVFRLTQISSALGVFDTVLMLGNNFGLFGTPKRARWLLRRLRGITSPEAVIIAESLDPYKTSEPRHLACHERNRRLGKLGGEIRIRAIYGDYKTPWLDLLLVSPDEMRDILQGTGWELREVIDSGGPGYVAVIGKAA